MLKPLTARLASATTSSLLASGVLAGPVLANGELDQEATFSGDNSSLPVTSDQAVGQVFTAGISGNLSAVDLGIAKDGNVTKLTVRITEVAGSVPSATPSGTVLATEELTGSDLDVVTTGQNIFTVNFTDPAQITAGSTYAITVATPDPITINDGYFEWYDSGSYNDGNAAYDNIANNGVWQTYSADLTFATYVTVLVPSNASNGGSQPARTITLSLELPAAVHCSSSSLTTSGPWIKLPGANDCQISPRDGDQDPSLLGWATQEEFPVEIAERQVDKGWGAYETYGDDGQLTGVFIPAGGYAALTGDTNLYPIWN